jgi:aldehyde dehydrogenase (NAD+)
MRDYLTFYIDGEWVDPVRPSTLPVENPATETVAGHISMGSAADVDRAVAAARNAFASWSRTTVEERIDVLQRVVAEYQKRAADLAAAVTEEMGAPARFAARAHVPAALRHLATAAEVLKTFSFREPRGETMILKEAIGVCGFITPWNWPLNQVTCKVAPALATGCTMVLKPSEIAPFSAQIFAEVLHAAGVPKGVFNLVHGDGPTVGAAISAHRGIDLVSFTGSTRAGVEVAKAAAPTVKRVLQELGGKSPNIVVDDAELARGVRRGVVEMMYNSGQSCTAPSRMLVPAARLGEAIAVAQEAAAKTTVGDPLGSSHLGPVASKMQFDKIQSLIQKGIDEGATLVAGGLGRPEGLDKGHYVRPTVFAPVTNQMTIAREEIFGPVLVLIPYDDLDQAVEIANDTDYGLAGYVQAADRTVARDLASRIRAGQVAINGTLPDMTAPFGGYKQSGNGREWGDYAFHDFLEVKAIPGWTSKDGA